MEMSHHQSRVFDLNKAKGWYDQPVSFLQAMALLVTEVDEAYGAYFEEGLKDGNAQHDMKSEIADIYIRLLDDCARFHVNLTTAVDIYRFPANPDRFGFADDLFLIIRPIVKAIEAYRAHGLGFENKAGPDIARAFAEIYHGIEIICRTYGVELAKAFDLKMSVNWVRPYRHGNKHA
jgi:hypothetical protein